MFLFTGEDKKALCVGKDMSGELTSLTLLAAAAVFTRSKNNES